MKILSIIIPTYNMEKYLQRCLDSLLVDEEHMQVLEVLVVNDGSKDGSLEIARGYEAKWPETFRVIDKPNGNYGSCINVGLPVAMGKYVRVLDADDCFYTDNFLKFLDELSGVEADLVISNFAYVAPDGEVLRKNIFDYPQGRYIDFAELCNYRSFLNEMWMHGTTYRRQMLIDMGYKQTEGISYTDQEWSFIPLSKVRTAYFINQMVYNYTFGREGQTMDPKVMAKSVDNNLKVIQSMINFLPQVENHPQYDFFLQRVVRLCHTVYYSGIVEKSLTAEQLKSFDNSLREASQQVYDLLNYRQVMGGVKFCYIAYWRKTQSMELPFWAKAYLAVAKFGKELLGKKV